MSKVCEICGKGPSFGHNVSHSHVKTPKEWKPNIQNTRVMIEGRSRRINICTKCLKKLTAGD